MTWAAGRQPIAGSVDGDDIELSIIAPAHNEQDNVAPLVSEVGDALEPSALRFELVVIDDGSTDGTLAELRREATRRPWLRVYRMCHTPPGRGAGQSAAFCAGIGRARGRLVALMDADRQNDPADVPKLVALLRRQNVDFVQGDRSGARRDTALRRFSSWVGRAFRAALLGDAIRDTGCSMRVFKREIGLALPLQYRGMHRFIPLYARMLGYRVVEAPVNHRPRVAGKPKYGVWNRALPGLHDLFAVRWMRSRLRSVDCAPVEPEAQPQPRDATGAGRDR